MTSPRAWCVTNPGNRSMPFGPYETKAEAEDIARELRKRFPGRAYEVQPDPHFLARDIPPSGLAPACA